MCFQLLLCDIELNRTPEVCFHRPFWQHRNAHSPVQSAVNVQRLFLQFLTMIAVQLPWELSLLGSVLKCS